MTYSQPLTKEALKQALEALEYAHSVPAPLTMTPEQRRQYEELTLQKRTI